MSLSLLKLYQTMEDYISCSRYTFTLSKAEIINLETYTSCKCLGVETEEATGTPAESYHPSNKSVYPTLAQKKKHSCFLKALKKKSHISTFKHAHSLPCSLAETCFCLKQRAKKVKMKPGSMLSQLNTKTP